MVLIMDRKGWSSAEDDKLIALKKLGIDNKTIAIAMERSESSVASRASRLRVAKSFVSDIDDRVILGNKQKRANIPCGMIGKNHEYAVKIKLAEEGFDFFESSVLNHRTDVIVLQKGIPIKIQIKTGTYNIRNKYFRVNLTTYSGANKKHHFYDNEEVDFFIIKLNGEDIFYVVPYEDCKEIRMFSFSPYRLKKAWNSKDNEQYRNAFHLIREFK